MFARRLAGHSIARITRALNDPGILCPSAADPKRNPHRSGTAWTLGTVAAILANPRYTGRQVWNRQRTDADLVDPANTGLGHKQVQRWNLPAGWVISARPARAEVVRQGRIHALFGKDEAMGQSAPQRRRREVDELDRAVPQERVRHGLGRVHAGDPGDNLAQRLDVGDVEGRVHVDAVREQLADR